MVYFAMQSLRVRMSELNKALADILEIRSRIAAGTPFRGYGPLAMSVTGLIGLGTALLQSFWLPAANAADFVTTWMVAGILCVTVVRIEMQGRSRRHHSTLATAMINQAIEQFLPAAAASVFLPLFIVQFAPESAWILPGLWQILVGIGIFASLRSLPRSIALAGGWYFLSGFACLFLASFTHQLQPWAMGLPFLAGQMLIAFLLHISARGQDDEA
jgi:hypothetical protein